MRFSQFISEQLDQQRGLQSRLARKLDVSRSTITAWRRGARPDFQLCLLLADHFRLDPFELFEMVEAPSYGVVYRRFFRRRASGGRGSQKKNLEERFGNTELREQPALCLSPQHAEIHRDLQELLEADNRESRAVVTLIQMGARRLRAGKDVSTVPKPDSSLRDVKKAG